MKQIIIFHAVLGVRHFMLAEKRFIALGLCLVITKKYLCILMHKKTKYKFNAQCRLIRKCSTALNNPTCTVYTLYSVHCTAWCFLYVGWCVCSEGASSSTCQSDEDDMSEGFLSGTSFSNPSGRRAIQNLGPNNLKITLKMMLSNCISHSRKCCFPQ